MSKYILKSIKDPTNQFEISDITFEIDTLSRTELIEQFIIFLSACGFNTEDLRETLDIE